MTKTTVIICGIAFYLWWRTQSVAAINSGGVGNPASLPLPAGTTISAPGNMANPAPNPIVATPAQPAAGTVTN